MKADWKPSQTRPLILSWPLWALMLLSIALTTPLAFFLNIRFDEAFTLQTTLQGPANAFNHAIGFGQQAPLYFVTMSFWRMIDPSIFFARFFSVLCFPFIVWIAAEVSKRYLKDINPLFAAAVIVVHQQAVWNSLDIRLYAIMTLLSGLLLLLFYDGYLTDRPNKRSRVLYTVVAVLSLYTQYYIGFQLIGGAVALVALRRWQPLGKYVLNMAIAGVLFVPMLIVISSGQWSAVVDQKDAVIPIANLFNGMYQRIIPLLVSVNGIEPETLKRWLARTVVALIAILFAAKIIRHRKSEDIALGVISIVMITFFLVANYLLGDQLIQQRHLSGLILPLVIIPLSAITLVKSKAVFHGWLTLVVALNIIHLYVAYKPMAKPGDFNRVAQYVIQNEQPNEPVLIFHADAILPLRFYYNGQNSLLAIPQENGTEVWNPRNNVLKDEAQVLNLINSQPNNPERFWLIHDGWCAHGSLSFNCPVLEDVVTKYFIVESTQKFLEPVTVRLLRRR